MGKLLYSADKNRAPYLKHDTHQAFGAAENYYLCIDSGKPGVENAVKIIEASYPHTKLRTLDAEGSRPQISDRFARVPLFPNAIFGWGGDIQLSIHEPVLAPVSP